MKHVGKLDTAEESYMSTWQIGKIVREANGRSDTAKFGRVQPRVCIFFDASLFHLRFCRQRQLRYLAHQETHRHALFEQFRHFGEPFDVRPVNNRNSLNCFRTNFTINNYMGGFLEEGPDFELCA